MSTSDRQTDFWSKVEKTDTCWNWTAYVTKRGYGRFWNDGERRFTHRLSYAWTIGPIPDGMQVDHMCHNRRCVRPDHLRLATHKENQENRGGAQANSKTGVRGVYPRLGKSGFVGCVRHEGKRHYVGSFATIEEAAAAVTAKRNQLFTHNNHDRMAS